MRSVDRENLYQQQELEGSSSAASTPGDAVTTTSFQTETPTTPLPPPSPRTITTTDSIPPLEVTLGPPPAYSFQPPEMSPLEPMPGPPPSYDECHNLNVPPPTYESLFGRVREVQKSSNGLVDFIKNLIILFLGTIGCTVMISVTIVIPIFMIIVGSLKMDECPAEKMIPIYLVIGGTFGVVKNLLDLQGRLRRPLAEDDGGESHDGPIPWHRRLQFTGAINFFLCIWFILGCVWVYRIYEPKYVEGTHDYCDFTLYQFAFWLITSVYIAVGLLTSCMCCLSVATVVMQHNRMNGAQV
ncbi:uncharacterized protein LOC122259542 isoform X1 [Penaeus japonicus]|uniref:uncharacterized protein LOC122259542 isoform X1 n=1 Tax=Penaeus japonicus TaxID=27405 RepID=UPI001C70B87F|nr:uncharacterized protein LOC122259542 isoform X1 [Penaeus japonicus]